MAESLYDMMDRKVEEQHDRMLAWVLDHVKACRADGCKDTLTECRDAWEAVWMWLNRNRP